MAAAVVGDDVMREDPTVQQLEQSTARLLGKEAGLFVPSGTMGNLISVLVHCNERGSEYIVGDQAHIYWYEQGGPAQVGGAHPRPVRTNPDGTLPLDELAAAIRSYDDHYPVTKLICLENTHNRCGGRVLPTSYVDAVGALARQHQLKVHIDGARLMNAAAALKEDPAAMVRSADSVSLCLSKGLGAPVGSVIVGTNEFVERARRYRKVLGGGMRQAGVLAAAGVIALETMRHRLAEDHANAQRFVAGLGALRPNVVACDPATVETNLVMVDLVKPELVCDDVVARLRQHGLLASSMGPRRLRFVTHHHITSADVDRAVNIVHKVLGA